jgi:hypothetical protein
LPAYGHKYIHGGGDIRVEVRFGVREEEIGLQMDEVLLEWHGVSLGCEDAEEDEEARMRE